MDLLKLKYPNKSHRKLVIIPRESTDLAEFIGIIAGDGGIGNNWQIVISLNSLIDIEYSEYILKLINRLFNINAIKRIRPNQNTLVIVCTSTTIVDFVISKGSVRGNKIKKNISIPHWVLKNSEYQKTFIRGLIDTDGCIYIHKHKVANKIYSNIGLCFTNYSTNLINQTYEILLKEGIKAYKSKSNHNVYLYSKEAVVKYLSIFGSSNSRITNKYYSWRDAGVV